MATKEGSNEKKSTAKKPLPEREFVQVGKSATTPRSTTKKTVDDAQVRASAPETTEAIEAPVKKSASGHRESPGEPGKSSLPWRIFAFVAWALAIAAMVMAVIMIMEGNDRLTIVGIVAAAVFCIVGAQLWKRANRISPTKIVQDGSFKSKILTFFYNQMGLVVTFIVFLPIGLILLLRSDKLSAQGKRVAAIVAAVLVVVAGTVSYDYSAPVAEVEQHASAEELEEQVAAGTLEIPEDLTGALTDAAYWTRYGYAYHFDPDCRAIRRSLTIYAGTLADAVEAKKVTPCSFCAKDGPIETEPVLEEAA